MNFGSKYITTILTALLMTLTLGLVQASEETRERIVNITLPTTYKTNYSTSTERVTTGLALSMGASAIDCTTTTRKWQIGGGIGYYGSNSAPVIGACKKYSGALFKASIGREDGITGGNIGVMFLLE